MNKKIKNQGIFFIIVLTLSFTLSYFFLSGNLSVGDTSQADYSDGVNLRMSTYGDSLNPSDIEINESIIYRNFQSVNISVNTTKWQSPGVSEVNLEMTFSNNTAFNLTINI
ncbi:MAG: hypothetical protein ACFE8P_06300 [Promethearchaeota archaeon]